MVAVADDHDDGGDEEHLCDQDAAYRFPEPVVLVPLDWVCVFIVYIELQKQAGGVSPSMELVCVKASNETLDMEPRGIANSNCSPDFSNCKDCRWLLIASGTSRLAKFLCRQISIMIAAHPRRVV